MKALASLPRKLQMAIGMYVLLLAKVKESFCCTANWIARPNSGDKYRFCVQKYSWQEARENCQNMGADLLQILSLDESDWLINLFAKDKKFYDRYWWIGLTDREYEGYWMWVDGTPHDPNIVKWSNTEPQDGHVGEKNCAEYHKGYLRPAECERSKNCFLCYMDDYGALKEKTYISSVQFNVPSVQMTWNDAYNECWKHIFLLAVIGGRQSNLRRFLMRVTPSYCERTWVGMERTAIPNKWKSIDQTRPDTDLLKWDPNSHDVIWREEDCAIYFGVLRDYSCYFDKFPFICKRTTIKTTSTTNIPTTSTTMPTTSSTLPTSTTMPTTSTTIPTTSTTMPTTSTTTIMPTTSSTTMSTTNTTTTMPTTSTTTAIPNTSIPTTMPITSTTMATSTHTTMHTASTTMPITSTTMATSTHTTMHTASTTMSTTSTTTTMLTTSSTTMPTTSRTTMLTSSTTMPTSTPTNMPTASTTMPTTITTTLTTITTPNTIPTTSTSTTTTTSKVSSSAMPTSSTSGCDINIRNITLAFTRPPTYIVRNTIIYIDDCPISTIILATSLGFLTSFMVSGVFIYCWKNCKKIHSSNLTSSRSRRSRRHTELSSTQQSLRYPSYATSVPTHNRRRIVPWNPHIVDGQQVEQGPFQHHHGNEYIRSARFSLGQAPRYFRRLSRQSWFIHKEGLPLRKKAHELSSRS